MIARYILLLTQFVAGDITADQFEHSYLEMFKNEKEKFPENVYDRPQQCPQKIALGGR